MINETRKTMIGGFVIGAMALGITALLIFGSGDFFKKKETYVLYFKDSVKGLNVGAPVLFRGVQIGVVASITLLADAHDMSTRIPVVIDTDPEQWKFTQGETLDHKNGVSKLINKGMRASMELQSIVTGKYVIQFDFHPNEPAHLVGTDLPYEELPTIQSGIEKISDTLEKLPLKELVQKLSSAISGFDNMINSQNAKQIVPAVHQVVSEAQHFIQSLDDQVHPLSTEISSAVNEYKVVAQNVNKQVGPLLSDYRKLARDIDQQIAPLVKEIRLTAETIQAGAQMAESTFKSAKGLISNDSRVFMELTKTLKELSGAARSIKAWADYLERHPEALIQGKGPYRR